MDLSLESRVAGGLGQGVSVVSLERNHHCPGLKFFGAVV